MIFSAVPCEHFVDGEDAVVFSSFSGETHHLSGAAWLVLEALQRRALTYNEIVTTVWEALDPLDQNSAVPLSETVLGELLRLRLIERQAGTL